MSAPTDQPTSAPTDGAPMRENRLVWVPFDPAEIGERPDGVEIERFDSEGPIPDRIGEVAFYVPAYRFSDRDVEVLERMAGLQVVQTLTAGVDFIRGRIPDGVALCNGRGIHDVATAEQAVTLTLAGLNEIPHFVRSQERREWSPRWRTALDGARVAIVGYGQIGAAIEARLTPFGCHITRVARSARAGVRPVTELADVLPGHEVVILIVPGTDETEGLMDADMLARLDDGALLVNVSRGSVVDGAALARELAAERLRAALDVTDPEPLPADDPLWTAPGCLITPHVGGASSSMWPRSYALVADQVRRFAAGEPLANVMTGAY